MLRSIIASLALAISIAAQTNGTAPCPHEGVDHQPTDVVFGGQMTCGGSRFQLPGGIQVQQPVIGCPLSVTITPARDVPAYRPDSNTYVETWGFVEIRTHHYTCKDERYFLDLFGSFACVHLRSQLVATAPTYRARPCALLSFDLQDLGGD